MAAEDPGEVPKLPRGRGLKLSRPELVRIALTLAMLVAILVLAKPCGEAVGRFVTSFDQGSGKGSAMPSIDKSSGAGKVDMPASGSAQGSDQYEHLRPGMTDEELKAAVERAKHKAAGSQSAGSSQ